MEVAIHLVLAALGIIALFSGLLNIVIYIYLRRLELGGDTDLPAFLPEDKVVTDEEREQFRQSIERMKSDGWNLHVSPNGDWYHGSFGPAKGKQHMIPLNREDS